MRIIVGLGNPGREYENTRHNAGFDALDVLAQRNGISISSFEKHAITGKGIIEGEKVMLVKPQTFMNLSGVCVRVISDYYKESPESLIIIYDDTALPVGKLRIRQRGSAGGHNGIKNIISELGTQDFCRLRVGVGEKPPKWDLADWVLSGFSNDDRKIFEETLETSAQVVEYIIKNGAEGAMNKFNG